jgi:hypothetical protein
VTGRSSGKRSANNLEFGSCEISPLADLGGRGAKEFLILFLLYYKLRMYAFLVSATTASLLLASGICKATDGKHYEASF